MKNEKVNALFDGVIKQHYPRVKNDAGLSRLLKVAPPVISKMRHGRLEIGASMILSLHENAGVDVAMIRRALADEVSK